MNNTDNIAELNQAIIACRLCPRLVEWREQVAVEKRRAFNDCTYWGKPVPAFGDINGRIMIIGLAPGAHGSNRTGRMFTGDSSGEFLFTALHKAGFANQPHVVSSNDGLALQDVFITAVCRCVPPKNKPTPEELGNCIPYLQTEINMMPNLKVIVALGGIAFDRTLRLFRNDGHQIPKIVFAHKAHYSLPGDLPDLIASYHPSRQNTQTGRLSVEMFDQIWEKAGELI
jgi:uracil-DNA glycosylase family 4